MQRRQLAEGLEAAAPAREGQEKLLVPVVVRSLPLDARAIPVLAEHVGAVH